MGNDPIVLEPPAIVVFGDGFFTGANGATGGRTPPGSIRGFDPASYNFRRVPAITPAVGERNAASPVLNKRIVYINGIGTPRAAHAYTVKLISVITGARVIGIYNQSGDGEQPNYLADLVQCLGDKTGLGNNPATNTLAKAVRDACANSLSLNVVAHSQGAIITSRGIRQGIGKLLYHYGRLDAQVLPFIEKIERHHGFFARVGRAIIGLDSSERIELEILLQQRILPVVERQLNLCVSAQTFGGAARFYPNGPRYRHVYNFWDPTPNLVGQGDIMTGPGRGAQVIQLNRNSGSRMRDFVADHSITDVYMQPSQNYVDRNQRQVDQSYIPIDMTMVRS